MIFLDHPIAPHFLPILNQKLQKDGEIVKSWNTNNMASAGTGTCEEREGSWYWRYLRKISPSFYDDLTISSGKSWLRAQGDGSFENFRDPRFSALVEGTLHQQTLIHLFRFGPVQLNTYMNILPSFLMLSNCSFCYGREKHKRAKGTLQACCSKTCSN